MFVAILVLFLGTLAATFVADIVRGATATARVGSPSIFAGVARWAIIGFAALIALEQLQIAPALINVLFTAIVGAVAIAFGLAFGLGGQDTARRWLARSENTVTDAAAGIQAQQSSDFYSTPTAANPQMPVANPEVPRGEEPHQVFRFEPDPFVPHRPPEKDERLGVEETACMGQLIKL